MSQVAFLTLQQDLGSRLRMDLNQPDQVTLLRRWLNQSQQEIWSAYDWPWALEREVVQTVSDKTAGTVSISAGARVVTGSGTSFSSSDVGKFIQFSSSNDWYKITAFSSATALTIENDYVGTSNLSAGTYTVRQMFYSVSAAVEKIFSIRQAVSPERLTLVPFRQFDEVRPHPSSTGNPTLWIPWGYDSNDRWTFTVYPFPSAALNLEVRYKKKATDLSVDGDISEIPEKWHATILLDGALYRGLDYVRSGSEDRRSENKLRDFQKGLVAMIADAEPESDYHPILRSSERGYGIENQLRLPDRYEK